MYQGFDTTKAMPMDRYEPAADDLALSTTEACAGALIVRQASVAGGLGACYAPNGEREGRSRLANTTPTSDWIGECEGRSRLAWFSANAAPTGEREGQSPLASTQTI
jgi:hypothetical protein